MQGFLLTDSAKQRHRIAHGITALTGGVLTIRNGVLFAAMCGPEFKREFEERLLRLHEGQCGKGKGAFDSVNVAVADVSDMIFAEGFSLIA